MSIESAMLLATAGATLATFTGAVISYLLFTTQTRPEVIVYSEEDPDSRRVIRVIVKNIGRAVARNVRFRTSRPVLLRCFVGPDHRNGSNPLSDGISYFAPGAERRIVWGFRSAILQCNGQEDIEVLCEYEMDHPLFALPVRIRSSSVLEVRSYASGDIGDRSELGRAVEELGAIRSAIKEVVSSSATLSKTVSRGAERIADEIRH